jgi:hypothetical protein
VVEQAAIREMDGDCPRVVDDEAVAGGGVAAMGAELEFARFLVVEALGAGDQAGRAGKAAGQA